MGTSKFIVVFFLFLGLTNTDTLIGKYSYSQSFFYESLQLNEDSTFVYNNRTEFTKQNLNGIYSIVGDSIILNSQPKREKIIVKETHTNSNSTTFNINYKDGSLMIFHLTVTTNNGKKIDYRDCFEKIKIRRKKIKSFHITNTSGLKSPEYFVQGTQANFFSIQFESVRVFENEKWYIDRSSKMVRPIGFGGEFENYNLKKEE